MNAFTMLVLVADSLLFLAYLQPGQLWEFEFRASGLDRKDIFSKSGMILPHKPLRLILNQTKIPSLCFHAR